MTSKSYGDDRAVTIASTDIVDGSLSVTSFARPGKIFTANEAIITNTVDRLTYDAMARGRNAVVALLQPPEPRMP